MPKEKQGHCLMTPNLSSRKRNSKFDKHISKVGTF